MPSIVGHFTVPLALRVARVLPAPLLIAGLAASMLPDADTLGLLLGAPHDTAWGHRGFTHSIAFAAAVALLAAACAPVLGTSRRVALGFVGVCALSHPLLDTFTNGGPGVMLGWPLSSARVFAPWRPIEVSPIGAGFFSARGRIVVASELVWIVGPASIAALLARTLRRSAS